MENFVVEAQEAMVSMPLQVHVGGVYMRMPRMSRASYRTFLEMNPHPEVGIWGEMRGAPKGLYTPPYPDKKRSKMLFSDPIGAYKCPQEH